MDDVAKEISISKKTLYKCFRDKESLVLSTVESHMRENEEAIERIIADDDKKPPRVSHLLFNIELGRSSGLYHTNFHAEIIATSFSMLSFHVFDNVELNSLNIGQDDVLIEIIKYHLRSISTEIGIETINSIDWKIKPS